MDGNIDNNIRNKLIDELRKNTVSQLKDLCKEKKLIRSGNKEALVTRLVNSSI